MPNEFAPQPREKLFDLSTKPQDDTAAPQQLLEEETRRVADTLIYRMTYQAAHPDIRDPREGPLDIEILDTIELWAFDLMSREGQNERLQLNPDERTFLGVFLGIRRPRLASGKAIRNAFTRRTEYMGVLHYAHQFGLTITEATTDMESGRAPLLPGLFDNPKLLTELRRRAASGNDPEFTDEQNHP